MVHFAFLSPPFRGHIDPMLALAEEIGARGHRATFLNMVDVAGRIQGSSVGFEAIGLRSHPRGTLSTINGRLGEINGLLGLGGVLRDMRRTTAMIVEEAPEACRRLGIDMIVGDQMEAGAGLVARRLGLPFVSVANALPLNRDPALPPPFTGWRYDPSAWGSKRNQGGYRVSDWLMRSHHDLIAETARRWRLGNLRTIEDCASPALQLSQMVEPLDFPRGSSRSALRYVGPLRRRSAGSASVTMPRRDGRPIVFASLGTLQGGRAGLFRLIADAAMRLDVDLVIAHGGGLSRRDIERLPGQPRVYDFVPQQHVLAEASLAILNGGMNTVLDALAAGVPSVLVPIAFEQAAIAERVAHAGAGLCVSRRFLTASRLSRAMRAVLGSSRYTAAARSLAGSIDQTGGAATAADLIAEVLSAGSPRLRPDDSAFAIREKAA